MKAFIFSYFILENTKYFVGCPVVLLKHNELPLVPKHHRALFKKRCLDGIKIHFHYLRCEG